MGSGDRPTIDRVLADTVHDTVAPLGDFEEETVSAIRTALRCYGYEIVDVQDPEHNLTKAQNGTYYCNDSIGMMCAGNWTTEAGWHRHLARLRP